MTMKKTVSLTENHLFRRLYRTGKCTVTPHVALYMKRNRLGYNRLGITTSKKLGNAVRRNRARRLIAEACRLSEDAFPKGFDIVAVARKKTVYAGMHEVRASLLRALAPPQGRTGRRAAPPPKSEDKP